MPTKRKFTAKFPTTRIKKIMQLDEDIGKLTATVPPVVSRSLELFMEQLITRAYQVTLSRNSKTISPGSIKYVIEHDNEFGFLKNLVVDVPEIKSLPQNRKTSNTASKSGQLSDSDSSDDELSADEYVSPVDRSSSKGGPKKRKRIEKHHPVVEDDGIVMSQLGDSTSHSSTKRTVRRMKSGHLKDVHTASSSPTNITCSIPFPQHNDGHGNSFLDCHPSQV